MDCYSKNLNEVVASFNTTENGLSKQEASKRLLENGKNELAHGKKKTMLARFFAQFKDVMKNDHIAAAVDTTIMTIALPQ